MHYKNGRPAANGDLILVQPTYGTPFMGVLFGAVAGNDHCNGYVLQHVPNCIGINLKEALRADDALAALSDSTKSE